MKNFDIYVYNCYSFADSDSDPFDLNESTIVEDSYSDSLSSVGKNSLYISIYSSWVYEGDQISYLCIVYLLWDD